MLHKYTPGIWEELGYGVNGTAPRIQTDRQSKIPRLGWGGSGPEQVQAKRKQEMERLKSGKGQEEDVRPRSREETENKNQQRGQM